MGGWSRKPGALVPPGGHLLTDQSHFQPPQGERGKMRKNPPALWTGTGKEKRNRRSLICCSGRVMVGFIYLGVFQWWDFQS